MTECIDTVNPHRVPLLLKVLNYVFFYIGWVISLQQASQGKPYLAPLVVGAILIIHLFTVKNVLAEILVIICVSLLGTFLDTLYILFGAVHYQAGYFTIPWLAPLWLTGIWALYAMCLNYSLSWLKKYKFTAALLGGLCAVICYSGAERTGAITILAPKIVFLGFIGLLWFFLFPLSLRFSLWILDKWERNPG